MRLTRQFLQPLLGLPQKTMAVNCSDLDNRYAVFGKIDEFVKKAAENRKRYPYRPADLAIGPLPLVSGVKNDGG